MDLLAAMRIFVRVVDTGGFSAVAPEFGTTQPTISRTIAALESHLGVRLLHRSARAMTVTADGRVFADLARRAVHAAFEAETGVGGRARKPAGQLRLSSSREFGKLYIAPLITEFLDRYPDVEVEMLISDTYMDLVAEGLDLAVRIGNLSDNSLVARRIGATQRVVVASVDYLARRGTPMVPTDLAAHECIVHLPQATEKQWRFEGPDGPILVGVRGRFASDSAEIVRDFVLCGGGITMASDWFYTEAIARGEVQILLRDYLPHPVPINAVYSSRRNLSAKVRAMIDFLAAARLPGSDAKGAAAE